MHYAVSAVGSNHTYIVQTSLRTVGATTTTTSSPPPTFSSQVTGSSPTPRTSSQSRHTARSLVSSSLPPSSQPNHPSSQTSNPMELDNGHPKLVPRSPDRVISDPDVAVELSWDSHHDQRLNRFCSCPAFSHSILLVPMVSNASNTATLVDRPEPLMVRTAFHQLQGMNVTKAAALLF